MNERWNSKEDEREQRIVLLLAGETKGMPLGTQGSLLDSGSASRNLLHFVPNSSPTKA